MNTSTIQSIQDGYKQTEVGIVPNDWQIESIKDVANIKTGSKNTQDRVNDGKYPFFVRSQIIERINSYSFDGEAVLTAGDGVGTGKVFHYINGKFDIHQRVYKISDFCKNLDGYFFYLYFSNNFYNRIMQMTAKSSVDSVRMEMIADMKIPLPKKPEQLAIATVLSNLDSIMQRTEKLIAKKKAIKQGAMQELLTGQRRLPGFSGEWKEFNMADCSSLKARIGWQGLTTAEYLEIGDYYLITGTDFKDGRINWSSCWHVDKKRYTQDKNIQLKKEDILLTKDGTIGKVGYIDSLPGATTLNSGVFVIRPINNSYHPLFFYYILSSKIFDNFLLKLQAGSTISHLYQKDFVSFSFNAPEVFEQKAIANVLEDMDKEIGLLEQKLKKYNEIKQGATQVLLTGKIRLIKN